MTADAFLDPPAGHDWVALTSLELPYSPAFEWVGRGSCGGLVGFFGVVRDHADGRDSVVAIDYEAYEDQVLWRLQALADEVRTRIAGLGRIVLWHRVGRLELGEASVAVVVSAPHRAEAFEAARFLIDTLKETVPIWKKEHWDGGADWAQSATPVRPMPLPVPEEALPRGSVTSEHADLGPGSGSGARPSS